MELLTGLIQRDTQQEISPTAKKRQGPKPLPEMGLVVFRRRRVYLLIFTFLVLLQAE